MSEYLCHTHFIWLSKLFRNKLRTNCSSKVLLLKADAFQGWWPFLEKGSGYPVRRTGIQLVAINYLWLYEFSDEKYKYFLMGLKNFIFSIVMHKFKHFIPSDNITVSLLLKIISWNSLKLFKVVVRWTFHCIPIEIFHNFTF